MPLVIPLSGLTRLGPRDALIELFASSSTFLASSSDVSRFPFCFYEYTIMANLWSIKDINKEFIVTMDIIKDIYMGKITKWNDSRLTAINPGKAVKSE